MIVLYYMNPPTGSDAKGSVTQTQHYSKVTVLRVVPPPPPANPDVCLTNAPPASVKYLCAGQLGLLV